MAGREDVATRRGSQEALLSDNVAPTPRAAHATAGRRPAQHPPALRAQRENVQQARGAGQRWRAAHAPDPDPFGDNSACRWLCRQIGRIVLGTLAVLLVMLWLLVGQLLSAQRLAPPALLGILAWAGVVGLYARLLSSTPCGLSQVIHRELSYGYAGFDQSLLDAGVAFTVATLAAALCGGWAASSTILRPRRCSWLPVVAIVLLHTGFMVAKLVVMHRAGILTTDGSGSSDVAGSMASAERCDLSLPALGWLLGAAQTSVVLVAAWSSRVWAQATPGRLKAAERKLVEARSNGRQFRQRVVAGIGTLEAGPREGAAIDDSLLLDGEPKPTSQTTRVIVLIHGLGAGNGLWCENIEALSARHRLICAEWPGCGRSTRSTFTAKTYDET